MEDVAEVKGAKKTAFSDTKVITGTQYTYSVKAFKNTKGKKTFSSYNKKGVTTIAGLYTLKLNSSRITLNPGKSYTLKVNGTKLTPAWRSSNSKIVTVNKKGRITAKKAGTAKITARLGGKKFVCTVTVKKASAAANKLAKNYAKVRNYINKNGRYSEDGSKYIEASIDAETTAILSYDTKSDKLDMGLSLQIKKEGYYKCNGYPCELCKIRFSKSYFRNICKWKRSLYNSDYESFHIQWKAESCIL